MTDRPILFSGPMVRALLAGRKTQTRRVIDFPGIDKVIDFVRVAFDKGTGVPIYEMRDAHGKVVTRPKGKNLVDYHYVPRFAVGDRLYVREAHHRTNDSTDSHLVGYDFADDPSHRDAYIREIEAVGKVEFFRHSLGGWGGRTSRNYPAMHMPRWASRLTLTVSDVRVQRLQQITEADAIAEGVKGFHDEAGLWFSASDAYWTLWDNLNADRGFGWDANPWVVAISFTVERRNIDEVRQ